LQHQKTVAEVVLRWHLQMGGSMIAKSSHPERIRENFQVRTTSKEKTFCNVVFDFIYLLGSSHPERIRENFQVYCEQREDVL
jgi:diketogulonate reductase-like aldo/keto reductase